MKILHISASDGGGAGIAARRLHFGLRQNGVDSEMLVLWPKHSGAHITRYAQNYNIPEKYFNKARNRWVAFEFNRYKNTRSDGFDIFTDDRTMCDVSRHPLIKEADIIHLHWIATMIDYTEFFGNIKNKPIVWTLHDKNPFTGGCHILAGCRKYETLCGGCPQLGSDCRKDLSYRIFRRKEAAYNNRSIQTVVPSHAMADRARTSRLLRRFKINVVHNGVPIDVFYKHDKRTSRDILHLPQEKTLILFGAACRSKNKGLKYLLDALGQIYNNTSNSNIALVIFGDYIGNDIKSKKFSVYKLGYIRDEKLLADVYSAADMLVSPSVEEGFSLVCIEAMACGTPVISFNREEAPEIIKTGETGLLAESKNSGDLSEKIAWMVSCPKEREEMGDNAQRLVKQKFSLEIHVRKHIDLYKSIIQK